MSKPHCLLLIDPYVRVPEWQTYNLISHIVSDYQRHPKCAIQSLQFFVPAHTDLRLRDVIHEFNPLGVISLGSGANITERRPWVENLGRDLKTLVIESGIPFLGICFSHQLLAHVFGCSVDYIDERHLLPYGKHHDYRRSRIESAKFRLALTNLHKNDYFSESALDLEFQSAIAETSTWNGKRWTQFQNEIQTWKLTNPEYRLRQLLDLHAPTAFIAHARHEQEVHDCHFPLMPASTSEFCEIDALVHESLPVYSVQTHPETHHISKLGERLIRNFIYLSSLLSQAATSRHG